VSKLPSLRNLEAFIQVANASSIRSAAETLNVTPSAVSRRIQSLEEEVGEQLFDRASHALTLTDTGQRYLNQLLPVFTALRTAAILRPSDGADPVRVAAYPPYCADWLADLFHTPRFMEQNIRAELVAMEASTSLLADVFIYSAPRGMEADDVVKLFDLRFLPICRPELISGGHLRTPADLHAMTLIGITHGRGSWSQWFALAGLELDPATYIVWVDSLTALMAEAVKGTGVGLGEATIVRPLAERGLLTAPWEMAYLFPRSIYMRTARAVDAGSPVDRFIGWLTAEVS